MCPPSDTPEPARESGLFARAQSGDQAAWEALFHACYPKVQRVVRRRISNGPLRRYIDSTDIANDVFGELAEKAAKFRFETIDEVRNFLVDAAHKRVVDEHRRHLAKKRDAHRVALGDGPFDGGDWGISSGVPTPSQFAVAQETDEKLRAAAVGEEGHRVLDLRREHYNNEEISERTGWSLRKVQRFLERLRPTFVN
jgi:RNA polymerase sigma factor (sigma-70 family)